ncbi:GGDEF domain-containing protein [Ruminococcus flavefaciens]|uniref:GGDEF domain-containing protein n=1 Tax=Ruminococcus flavefaciens TaxID=1265 RepID=UPI0026EE9737|nr:GGDEF domain-containing protein [Ruminococcus flavefaciens]
MYTKENYEKDLGFIEKMDHLVSRRIEFIAYFFALAACLAAHILYFFLFLNAGVKNMAIFNVFSVLFYALTIILIKKVKNKLLLAYAALAEIIIHASLATICVGWVPDFGMFLLMIIPIAFLMPNKNKKAPFVVMFTSILLYGVLKYIYRDHNYTVYNIDNTAFASVFYFINIFIGSFVLVYATTIYTFMNRYTECKLRVQNEQLRIMASVDPLTKLSNRRAMHRNLTEICEKSRETGRNYVLGIGDIDNFKQVNDTYGHDFGDCVLSTVAEVISDNLPDSGCAARWGGEEFLFVIPDEELEKGRLFSDKIVTLISQQQFVKDDTTFSVTMTIGICEGAPDDIIDKVISQADKRLYKGKRNGKNHTEYTD